jgi:hypothetical protein
MKTFRDKEGREWRLEIDLQAASRLKSLLGVNLFEVFDEHWTLYRTITTDPEILLNVLYRLCHEQADRRGMDAAAFAAGFSGEVIGQAVDALTLELLDFFPDGQKAQAHRETYLLAKRANSDLVEAMTFRPTWRNLRIFSAVRSVFRRRASLSASSSG